jgi:uncharacterized protein DUF4412
VKFIAKCACLFAAFCLLSDPLLAADGIQIVEKSTTGATTRTSQAQIEKTRMRSESTGPNGTVIMVFDGTAEVMRTIDMQKKTYTEMTKADVDRMGTQLSGAMAKMQEQMKNMSPAARAQMEAMMKGRGMSPGAPAKTEYRKAGKGTSGKWSCDKYEGYRDNVKTSELCTVDAKTLGFTPADFQVTQQLAKFFQAMVPQGAEQMFNVGTGEPQGFSGVPVRRSYTLAGRETVSELTDVSRQNFPDSLFAVPAGFTKQAFPGPR